MKAANDFFRDIMDIGDPANGKVAPWTACKPVAATVRNGTVIFSVPFQAWAPGVEPLPDAGVPQQVHELHVAAHGDCLRLSASFDGTPPAQPSPMLELGKAAAKAALRVKKTRSGWDVRDGKGRLRMRVDTSAPVLRPWGGLDMPPAPENFTATFYPDGRTPVALTAHDAFIVARPESFGLAYLCRDGKPTKALFSMHAEPAERFAGTGERFARSDLSGQTLVLENTDAQGVNNRRAYKNIPFYLSSRPYGLFMHTPAHIRLSLAGVSTRAAQAMIEEPALDLFVIGGGSLERILSNYRSLTGFPALPPLWSYGTWMSRMTYYTADEVRGIGRKLRAGGFPCDVLHLDTGWFAKDWICEWRFGEKNFPDPAGFAAEMKKEGFRISLWQTPTIGQGNCLLETALAKRYVAPRRDAAGSEFSGQTAGGQIDFSNPDAVRWYQEELLKPLLRMGYAAIKTDFGEDIAPGADYMGMPAAKLHNLYALLYQKAAFDVTKAVRGDSIIWARAAWAGCQRFPLHWGGDAACTWDGMAGSLRGGLHFGMSGFAFWSHDVPGFHGLPSFMTSWPTDNLYVRWTQFGVFSSHLRYHGTTPREPYEYPKIAPLVRKWLRMRYCLIPYLMRQAEESAAGGMPVLRALALHHEDDPTCWQIDDQFYCGRDFLVAPVMNDAGVRDIYLPAGKWVDLWSGGKLEGPRWLKNVKTPLAHMPVYVRAGASVPVYPEAVDCTDRMDMGKVRRIKIDRTFRGLSKSILGKVIGL